MLAPKEADETLEISNKADQLRAEGNYSSALLLYEKAAALGHAHSQVWAGNFYDRGLGTEKDYVKAVRWFELAAKQNNATAINNLASMYEKGKGVPQNGRKAADLYLLASQRGNYYASKNLASLYHFGKVLPQNYELAAKYYNIALDQGSTDNVLLNNLGVLYMDGKGVPQDFIKAKKLLSMAIQGGNKSAKSNLDLLNKHLSSVHQSGFRKSNPMLGPALFFAIILVILLIIAFFPQEHEDPWTNEINGTSITCRYSGCGKEPVYSDWEKRYCSEHLQNTHTCHYPGCNVQVPNSSGNKNCPKHR